MSFCFSLTLGRLFSLLFSFFGFRLFLLKFCDISMSSFRIVKLVSWKLVNVGTRFHTSPWGIYKCSKSRWLKVASRTSTLKFDEHHWKSTLRTSLPMDSGRKLAQFKSRSKEYASGSRIPEHLMINYMLLFPFG